MDATKKEAPEAVQPTTRAKYLTAYTTDNKDNTFRLSFQNPIRQRLYELFLSGGKFSVVQLSVQLRIPDPRSHIRYIRQAGIPISDYWQTSANYRRYKIYFLSR
jgi:hypothetical protein